MRATIEAFSIYGRLGPLQIIDSIVNIVIPVVLVVSGIIVIVQEKDFITDVLNTTALLFIPEIDDILPKLLGFYDITAIEENAMSNNAGALEMFNRGLVIRDNVYGKDHPDTAESYSNIRLLYQAISNTVDALKNAQPRSCDY